MASLLPSTAPRSVDRSDVSDRPGPVRRIRDIWTYRELLGNLVRKELKVKYKNSALGFVWSLLNPMLYLVVFWIVLPGAPRKPRSCALGLSQSPTNAKFWLPNASIWLAPIIT